jgi:UDP-2,3-diacylglucosamine pyrophosphatase LpxH
LLRLHNYDPKLFKLVSAKNSKWNSGDKTLYSSKITVKPIQQEITEEIISGWFDKLDRKYSKPIAKISNDYLTGNKMLLLDISDLHMNLQASMLTAGNEYNCNIAEKLFFYVINDVLSRTQNYKFNKIIFTIGGDILNADNLQNTTTKGTPQTCDIHLYDAYERVCNMTIKAIDVIKNATHAPIDVIYIAGNHDESTGFKLAKYVQAWFRNEDDVTVDTSPLPRKYVVFGKTLFVFSHDGDIKKLPKIIADEARAYWSNITFTEVFLQHLHTEQILLEENNMRIQRLPTISAKSKWTNDNGFNSKRQCKSFIYDINDGLTDVLYTPIKRI